MSNDADTVSKGTSLGGCTVQEKLSQRAGATRYRALRESGEECVITVYDERCFPSALVRERSIRELRQLSSLDSPKILGVLEVGKLDDGGIYEVNACYSEYNLAKISGPLEESEAFGVLRSIGDALLAAQNAGVIHRNLGPELVYLEEGSSAGTTVKVGGFGVAEPQGEGSFGPLATCAPEQAAGKVVDQRSMVYNLAALGHRLLTGKDLYEGTPAEVLAQHREAEIPSGVHPRLSRGLQKDARRRPMMLKQFLDELSAAKGADSSQSSAVEGQKPSTRGWTQFMDDDEVEGGSATGGSSAPKSSDSASAKKPATRGWTMFMESSDAEPEPEQESPAKAPAAQEKSPKTRGWTMFMDSPDEEEKPEEKAPEPAVEAKADKPKTRGWTMFMEDEPGPAPAASKPAASSPTQSTPAKPQSVAPAAQDNAVAASAQAPAVVAKQEKGPSTRGWTQFMDAPPGSENAPEAPTLDNQLENHAAAAAVASHASELSAPAARPSANGGGVEHEIKSHSKSTSSGAPAKSAVEASNRRVSMGMPKPADDDSQLESGASQSSSASKTKTVVLGGSQAEAVAGPSVGSSPAEATPSAPSANSSSSPAASEPALASATDLALDKAAARPLTDPTSSQASTSTSSVPSKNPIPESPAPQGATEPSLVRVAIGAGLVGVVIAALALLVMFLLG